LCPVLLPFGKAGMGWLYGIWFFTSIGFFTAPQSGLDFVFYFLRVSDHWFFNNYIQPHPHSLSLWRGRPGIIVSINYSN
jgi:hypothetical protein